MKKILTLAVFLLNLLSLTEVSAQNYSSETGLVDLLNKIVADAKNSEAEIYTVVLNDPEYEFGDYSEYGDFSQEVVTSDGEHYYYNYGNMGSTTENSIYCPGVPYEVTDIELTHMVTIVGYDDKYYYCAYGGKDAVRIPMSAIDEHSIYTCGGLNYEELKRLQNKND